MHIGPYLVHGVLGEQDLRLFSGDRRVDNDVLSLPPVHWGGDAVLVADLERYEIVRQVVWYRSPKILTINYPMAKVSLCV